MSSKVEEHKMNAKESSNNNPEPNATLFDPRFAKRNLMRTEFEGKNPWKKILKEAIHADDDGKSELIVSKHDAPWRICIILFSEATVLLQIIIGSFVVGMNMKHHVLYVFLSTLLVQSLVTVMSLMIYYHHQSKEERGASVVTAMFPAVMNVILLLVAISYAFHKTKESPSLRMTKIVTPQLKAISYTKWIKKISDAHFAHTRMKSEANEKVSPISNKTAKDNLPCENTHHSSASNEAAKKNI